MFEFLRDAHCVTKARNWSNVTKYNSWLHSANVGKEKYAVRGARWSVKYFKIVQCLFIQRTVSKFSAQNTLNTNCILIPCPSNHSALWIRTAENPSEVKSVYITFWRFCSPYCTVWFTCFLLSMSRFLSISWSHPPISCLNNRMCV